MSLAFAVLLGAVVLTFGWPAAAAEPETLIFPRPSASLRWDYALKVAELALQRSGGNYLLETTAEPMTQGRAARELEEGRVDFIWAGTSADYEERFRPIRIPLLRGLEGYRICIISASRQTAFSAVESLDDLKRFSIGQGRGWSDVTILEAAGFEVVTGPAESLPAMVARNHVDCFLRGVHEANEDVAKNEAEHPTLAVESEVLLVYPFASFFFVNRNDTALAEALQSGLEKAYEDGSFMALFNSHPAITAIFSNTRMAQRRRFDIPNPLLPAATRTIPDRYWHSR